MRKQKKKPEQKSLVRRPLFWICFGAVLTVAVVCGLWFLHSEFSRRGVMLNEETVRTARISGFSEKSLPLGTLDGTLEIVRAGIFDGPWVEQGTDIEQKTLAVLVCNHSGHMIRFAGFSAYGGSFVVTWLPAGGCCLVQEQAGSSAYDQTEPRLDRIDYWTETPELHPETVEISGGQGWLTMINLTGADIPGSVSLWYKTVWHGLYFGGITYKASVDDGAFRAGASATLTTPHYDPEKSVLLLVTLDPE